MKLLRSLSKDRKGSAAIEFAILALPFFVVIFAIVFGALAFAQFITLTGMTMQLVEWIQAQHFSVLGVLVAMVAIYLVLGALMEAMGLLLLTAPIFTAVAVDMGVNPVWFGIFVVLVVEMAQITPPVGFNLFVLQGMTGREVSWIARVTLPFFFLMIAAVTLIYFFPQIVTFLPEQMRG